MNLIEARWLEARYIPFMQLCGFENPNLEELKDLYHRVEVHRTPGTGWKDTDVPFLHGVLLYALSFKVPLIELPSNRSEWPAKVYKRVAMGSAYSYEDLLRVFDEMTPLPCDTLGTVISSSTFGNEEEKAVTYEYEGRITRYVWWSMLPAFEVAPVVGQKDFHRLTYLYFVLPQSESSQNQFCKVKFVPKKGK